MKVKVCGITNLDDAQLVIDQGADAIGFIFYKKSKRYIEPDAAKNIVSSLPFFTMKVGVFVDEDISIVNETANYVGLNSVQLHGNESIEYCKEINLPLTKVFSVGEHFDYSTIADFNEYQIMLDTYSSDEQGGTGKNFDWNLIPIVLRQKIILAGGISEDHIDEIITKIKPQAIDLSSSLEEEPGKKDRQKVLSFFKKLNKLRNM